MKDEFVQRQWNELCEHLERIAEHISQGSGATQRCNLELHRFCEQEPPERYQHLLQRVRDAAELASTWRKRVDTNAHDQSLIDEAGAESFPASDPPVFSQSHA